ncbi:MAG: thioredoxin family protein [Trueperaceae bacterium]
MAVTSTMLELGTLAPVFTLHDVVSGKQISNEDYTNQPLLVMFICDHCPYVKHVEKELAKLGRDYVERFGIVAIGSNDVGTYPDDSPEHLKAQAKREGFVFPYLYDETQEIAKAYTAACTPDFFLFNAKHKLVYRGRIDASRPKTDDPVTGQELRAALESVLAGKEVSGAQYPSMGCNIKWKAGNAPIYYG